MRACAVVGKSWKLRYVQERVSTSARDAVQKGDSPPGHARNDENGTSGTRRGRPQSTRALLFFGPSARRVKLLSPSNAQADRGRAPAHAHFFSCSSRFLSCVEPLKLDTLPSAHGTLNEDAFHPFMMPLSRCRSALRRAGRRGKEGAAHRWIRSSVSSCVSARLFVLTDALRGPRWDVSVGHVGRLEARGNAP